MKLKLWKKRVKEIREFNKKNTVYSTKLTPLILPYTGLIEGKPYLTNSPWRVHFLNYYREVIKVKEFADVTSSDFKRRKIRDI